MQEASDQFKKTTQIASDLPQIASDETDEPVFLIFTAKRGKNIARIARDQRSISSKGEIKKQKHENQRGFHGDIPDLIELSNSRA